MSPVTGPVMRVVVVGNGMVGARFAQDLLARARRGTVEVTVLGAEEYEPYNRVLLSDVVAGKIDVAAIGLAGADGDGARVRRGSEVIAIDRQARRVLTADGAHPYDVVVLATGAAARVPDVPGLTDPAGELARGVHTLRTLDDAREIVAASTNARRAVVVGAGVLGLEVACGLARRGLPVALVHTGRAPMDRQLGAGAGDVVTAGLARLGVRTWTRTRTEGVVVDDAGRVRGVGLRVTEGGATAAGGYDVAADLVVLACGTVPETGLARAAGLTVDRGVVVGEDLASPDDGSVYAIGDCAQPPEGATGLIAQGWDQARRLAETLAAGGDADGAPGSATPGWPLDTGRPSMALRLATNVVVRPAPEPDRPRAARAAPAGTDVVRVKAAGLEIVAMGVCGERAEPVPGHRRLTLGDPDGGRHVEVLVADGLLVGATCVGAPDVGADLTASYTRRIPVPADPAHLLVRPVTQAPTAVATPTHMPERTTVCQCNGVTKGDLVACWHGGARSVADLARETRATTGCGGCGDVVRGITEWLASSQPDISQPEPAPRENSVTGRQRSGHGRETSAS